MFEYNLYKQSADYLKNIFPSGIKTALILGSGLGNAAEKMTDKIEVDYSDIPGFARSTVESHRGVMSAGRLFGTECIVMSGRFHYYEGYDFDKTAFPVYVMKLLGVENLIVTNAAGGINEQFSAGNFMAISDHIKLTALSPARGRNDDRFGERFFDMTNAYDAEFLKLVNQTAADENITLRNGVYAFMSGPQFETPAEIRMLRTLGADAVGMSTVAEVIAAAHCKMRVLGVSCISNMAAGIAGRPISDSEVCETTNRVSRDFERLIAGFLRKI